MRYIPPKPDQIFTIPMQDLTKPGEKEPYDHCDHVGPKEPEFEAIEGEHPHDRYKRLVAFKKATAKCLRCTADKTTPKIDVVYGQKYLPFFGHIICKNHPRKGICELPYPPLDYKPAWVKYCGGIVCPACKMPVIEIKESDLFGEKELFVGINDKTRLLEPYPRRVHFLHVKSEVLMVVGQQEKSLAVARIEHVCMKESAK